MQQLRWGQSFPIAEAAMGELSPPHNSEQLMGCPTFPLLWIIPVLPWAPLRHRPTLAEASPAITSNPLAITRGAAWLPPARFPRCKASAGLRWLQPLGCHYWPVCHVAISVTERNNFSQGKALAEVINERFWVFLENRSISGMT